MRLREADERKRWDNRLAAIGPRQKRLAFCMNNIGVLADDVEKEISEQAKILSRQGSYSHATAIRIIRAHLSIAIHSFNETSVNIRLRHPNPLNPTPPL